MQKSRDKPKHHGARTDPPPKKRHAEKPLFTGGCQQPCINNDSRTRLPTFFHRFNLLFRLEMDREKPESLRKGGYVVAITDAFKSPGSFPSWS